MRNRSGLALARFASRKGGSSAQTITMPSLRAVGALARGTGNVTPAAPAGLAANDVELLFVECNGGEAAVLGTPANFAEVADSPQNNSTLTRLTIFWRRWNGTDGDPTVTDPGNHACAFRIAFQNCITSGNPWDVTAGDVSGSSSTTATIPGDTTTVANCFVVAACACGTDTLVAQGSSPANADLTNVSIVADLFGDDGGGGGVVVITGGKATAGAFGATTCTLATGANQARIAIALKGAVS